MQIIPLQAVASQQLSVLLEQQDCQISVYQKSTGLFFDLFADGVEIISGVICQNLNLIVRSLYLGFNGDLVFMDNQNGNIDPDYTQIGSRFSLVYLTVDDLAALAAAA